MFGRELTDFTVWGNLIASLSKIGFFLFQHWREVTNFAKEGNKNFLPLQN